MTPIRLVISDVDGTLVTMEKRLTEASVAAVGRLREAGIAFAVTSGRPPRGMAMLVDPLCLTTPIGGFNGGLMVDRTMAVLEERPLPGGIAPEVVALLERHGLDVWAYRGAEWFVRDKDRPHVDREAATVEFAPTVRDDLGGLTDRVVKLVGVSDDHGAIQAATDAAREELGDRVSASASQPYYLDFTHPEANKGTVVAFLADHLGVEAPEIATIGDMPNDVLMFARSGLSIAMGNADREVQRCARRVTATNDDDGFALAVERFVLAAP